MVEDDSDAGNLIAICWSGWKTTSFSHLPTLPIPVIEPDAST